MEIKCNCCDKGVILTLGEPLKGQRVFCDCGKLLAVGRIDKKGQKSWFVYDIYYDSDHDFSPVTVLKKDEFYYAL